MKVANGIEVISAFEELYPKKLAYEGDKIGLLIGTLRKKVERVLITLDVTKEVIEEAIENEANLIIAHHPLIFSPLKHIHTDELYGQLIEKCIKNDIAIYAAHTNVDIAENGVNDFLAEALELQNPEILTETYSEKLFKLVVYVPVTHTDVVFDALCKAGAGAMGDYADCSFRLEGKGTFTPLDNSNPYIGIKNELETVDETRLEMLVPEMALARVTKAMQKSHPYEEVAYDIIALEQKGKTYGLGRIGKLETEQTLEEFAAFVKVALDVEGLRFVGDPKSIVKKVAVIGGDGNKYIYHAKRKGADVLVTGDMYYHVAQDAQMMNLSIVDPGHHVEKVFKAGVTKHLQKRLDDKKLSVTCIPSVHNTDPFRFL